MATVTPMWSWIALDMPHSRSAGASGSRQAEVAAGSRRALRGRLSTYGGHPYPPSCHTHAPATGQGLAGATGPAPGTDGRHTRRPARIWQT